MYRVRNESDEIVFQTFLGCVKTLEPKIAAGEIDLEDATIRTKDLYEGCGFEDMQAFDAIVRKFQRADEQRTNGSFIIHNGMQMTTVLAADVEMRAVTWLWEGHLPRGMIDLLTGLPDVGKSQIQCDFVACVTTGRDWPDGTKGCAPGNVLMLAAEDVIDMTIVPRLVAAGADMKRVKFIKDIKPVKHPELGRTFMLTPGDIALLERAIKEWNAVLVTIDPITAYFSGKGGDQHKAGDVRSQFGPLKGVAERTLACISAITHPAKSTSQRAIDQFIGSQAFVAVMRVGHIAAAEYDPETNEPTGG
jgi:RecA-family ATPase